MRWSAGGIVTPTVEDDGKTKIVVITPKGRGDESLTLSIHSHDPEGKHVTLAQFEGRQIGVTIQTVD